MTLVFFQQLSLVGFVANLVAIPLVTLFITPLALAGVLLPGLWTLAAAATAALQQGLGGLAALPWAQWNAAAVPPWVGLLGVAGGALLVMPLPWRLRLLGLPLMLPLLAPAPERPPPGRFELLALDVGQGTAVLVRTRHHLLVYDAGPLYSTESDAGQRLLVPLLRARGDERIDQLVLSHRDSDHVGGAASLLARVPVAALSTSLADDHPLRATALPHQPCRAGQRWQWDGVDFAMLHPDEGAAAAGGRPNSVSCVLRVSAAQGSALLTGDIERAAGADPGRTAAAGAAQRRAAGAAPRQPQFVDRGLHRRRGAARGGGAGRLPQPFRPPRTRRGGTLCRTRREGGAHRRLRRLDLGARRRAALPAPRGCAVLASSGGRGTRAGPVIVTVAAAGMARSLQCQTILSRGA